MTETGSHAGETAVDAIDELRLELERCRRELESSRQRVGELAHGEILLAGENRLLEMVARGAPLTEILAAHCQLIEELTPGSLCGILLYDRANNRVEHGAAPSLPKAYNDAIHHRTVTREAGPCGTALCLKEQVIAADIDTDPRWDAGDWRRLALAHDLRACWSTPILSCDGDALGTFAIYWREVRSPAARDQQLLAQITHLAAVSVERRRIEEKLRENESNLIEAIDTIPGLVWSVLPNGEVDFLNQRWREYTGLTLKQARGWGWSKAIHPDDLARLETYWRSTLTSGKPGEIEARLRRFDGSFRWFLFRAVPLYDDARTLVKWYGQNIDIDERKRAEALLAGEKRMLEMIAQGDALPTVLDALCRLVETVTSDSLAAILLLDSDGKLWHAASPSLPASYTEGMGGIAIGPEIGSCGTAAYRREPVIICDISTDPLWVEYRSVALAHGLRASWSTPIFSSNGQILGTFAILSHEPRSPSPQHHHLIEQITHLASIAIDRKRSEDALRGAKARFEGILEIAEDAIVSVDASQQIVLFNQGAEKLFGYAQGEMNGKPLDLLLPQRFAHTHRGHIESFGKSPEVARTMAQRREVFGRRKDGSEFPAEASISKLDLGGELVFTVILRDITERKKAAEALRASEYLARGQLEALASSLAALSRESVPEKFLEHVLRIAGEQLDAVGISVWEMSEQSDCVELAANYQDRVLHLPARNGGSPSLRLQHATSDHPVWTEFFRTGKQCVYGRIQDVPPWSEVAIHPDGPWHDWRAGMVDNPVVPQMIKDIAASGIVATLNVPMLVADKVAGLFVLCFKQRRPFRQDEIELTRAMANQAMLAVKLMRLSQANRESAVIGERNRMARDLHDTLAQGFTGVIMQLEATKGAMVNADAPSALTHIERAEALARASLGEARRSVRAMRSRSLLDGTLSTALDDLLKRMTSGTELQAELAVQGEGRPLPPEWEEGLLRIAQESLTNTIKYAQARRFRAALNFAADTVRLQLVDDGRGFDPQAEHEGFGLVGMRERAEQLTGNFILRSKAGQGTEIVIELYPPGARHGNHESQQA